MKLQKGWCLAFVLGAIAVVVIVLISRRQSPTDPEVLKLGRALRQLGDAIESRGRHTSDDLRLKGVVRVGGKPQGGVALTAYRLVGDSDDPRRYLQRPRDLLDVHNSLTQSSEPVSARSVTKADGTYSIGDLPAGKYRVVASLDETHRSVGYGSVYPIFGLDTELVIRRGNCRLVGHVVDSGGVPWRGKVGVYDSSERGDTALLILKTLELCQPDVDGRFEFRDLPPGPSSVVAFDGGVVAAISEVLKLPLTSTFQFVIDRTAAEGARGNVTEAGTTRPLPGVVVEFLELRPWEQIVVARTSSDSAGRFQLITPNCGLCALRFSSPDHATRVVGADETHDARVELRPATTLSGTVQSATDGTPVAGAIVILTDEPDPSFPLAAQSDSNGHFEIPGVGTGPAWLVVAGGGWASTIADGALWRRIKGTDAVALEARRTGALEARVTSEDGSPMVRALVEVGIEGVDASEPFQTNVKRLVEWGDRTDTDGRVRALPLLPGVTYRIQVWRSRKDEDPVIVDSVRVPDGATATVELRAPAAVEEHK